MFPTVLRLSARSKTSPLMSNVLCSAFSKVSIDTWFNIQEARDLNWLGEETLTDLMIRDLLRLQIPGFSIKTFHKKEERGNGSDWEWWFQGNSGKWIGMRVQAKVIHKDVEKFKKLHDYHVVSNARFYQCDTLIASANDNTLGPCIPIYCLYSHWTDPNHNLILPDWASHLDPCNFGCSIIPAAAVRHLRIITPIGKANKCNLTDTLPYTIPLAGLVCSPFSSNDSIAERVQAALEVGSEYLLASPPRHIIDMLEFQGRRQTTENTENKRSGIDSRKSADNTLLVRQLNRP